MKKTAFYIVFVLLLGAFCQRGMAQVSNTGKLYVLPGTTFSALEDFENSELGSFYNDGKVLLYADLKNEGLVYYQETGLFRFAGFSEVQEIGGQGQTFFDDLIFDNRFSPVAFLVLDTLTVDGQVDFRRGIIDSDSYSGVFVFEENAGYTGASQKSHIDGPVVKRGDKSFRFPVGDQRHYRFASLSEPDDASEKYETKYFKENSDEFYPHANKEGVSLPGTVADSSRVGVINYINESEYWRITPVTGQSDLLLTLSWDESTTPDEIWQHPEAIHIVRWDAERKLWVDEGGVVDEADRTVTTAVSEYGIFTLGTVNVEDILPCQVVVYNAISPNNDGLNDYFLVDTSNSPEEMNRLSVQIFNRWGTKVFESNNYGQDGNLFSGYSEAPGTVGSGKLPAGTYFYTLEYGCGTGEMQRISKAGYIYLSYD